MLSQRGVSIGRNRLSAIENGKDSSFSMNELFSICDIFQCDAGSLLGEYEEKTQDKHFIHQQTGLTETAIDFLRPHSHDWQTAILSALLEEYPDFISVLSGIGDYCRYYERLENEKNRYDNESRLIRHEEKDIDVNDWKKLFELEHTRTIFKNTIENHEMYVKALRLGIYESFIAVVDKVVARQYKKHSK